MSQIVRIVQGRAGTISVTLTVDGVATDPAPATATIEIVRADGSVLVSAGSPTGKPPATTGKFTFALAPAQTALVGRLSARWTVTLVGYLQTLTTMVEVVGLAQIAARDDLAGMTAAGESPKLSDDDLYDLLDRHAKGASWDLDAAASEGWRWKAGRATTATAQNLDGSFSFDQAKYDALVRQAEYYESLARGGEADNRATFVSVGLGGRAAPAPPDVSALP